MDNTKSISETITITVTSAGGGGSNPTWSPTPSNKTITSGVTASSISFYARANPTSNGITYSASGLPGSVSINSSSGTLQGTPSSAGTYSATIKATDMMDNTKSISETITIIVSASVGGFDINGFSTTSPYNHKDTGTIYNNSGRNYQGYNAAGYNYNGYNSSQSYASNYDQNVSPTGG